MEYILSILTPVHIHSGMMNPSYTYSFESPYKKERNVLYRYKIEDLLKYVPIDLLNTLRFDNNKGKGEVAEIFKHYVKYNREIPMYSVYSGEKFRPLDISEQMKSLDKALLPGSTIKGAILAACYYKILNDKKEECRKILESNDLFKASDIYTHLFDRDFKQMFVLFSRCIVCRDINFDNMVLCKPERLKMQKKGTTFNYLECIDNNQNFVGEIFRIDQVAKKTFEVEVSKNQKYDFLLRFLNEDFLLEACNKYTRDAISDDKEYFYKLDTDIGNDIFDRIDYIDNISPNGALLRVGKYTNYFYKSISLFFKKNFNVYYKRKFNDDFSPVKYSQRNQKKMPKPDTMPNTRTVVEIDGDYYLPGMILIEEK